LCGAIAGGANSVLELGQLTKAGTGCGSCRTEIAQLIALRQKPMALDAAS
jgi:NAD(P)H-nitrite reductase large subunit